MDEELEKRLRYAYQNDGRASYFISFEKWVQLRSIAHEISEQYIFEKVQNEQPS